MKKYFIYLVLSLVVWQTGQAQSVERFIQNVSKTEGITKVKIGCFMMSLGKMFGGVSDMPVVRGIHSLEVYDFSDCSAELKQNLSSQMNNLKDGDGYESLVSVKDKGDNVRIMTKKKKDVISNVVIVCMGQKNSVIVKLSGDIKEEDIAELSKYN